MTDSSETLEALGRAGRRAAFHLIQALIEGLKAVEAVIDEVGHIADESRGDPESQRTKIEIE